MAMKLTSVTYPNLFIAGPHHIPVIVCPLVNLSVNYGEYHHVASRVLNVISTNWTALLYPHRLLHALGLCGYAYSCQFPMTLTRDTVGLESRLQSARIKTHVFASSFLNWCVLQHIYLKALKVTAHLVVFALSISYWSVGAMLSVSCSVGRFTIVKRHEWCKPMHKGKGVRDNDTTDGPYCCYSINMWRYSPHIQSTPHLGTPVFPMVRNS